MEIKKNVLITGTSSGIGKSCVKMLALNNYKVFAGIRNHDDIGNLNYNSSKNIIPVVLDISNEESINKAWQKISKELKNEGLYGLINNAAIAIGGPVEISAMEIIKKQFEVNLFGQIKVIQKFLPLLRMGRGRVINISSTNGFLSFTFMGIYCSTKFAFEAISDALRIELRPWNIPVSVINPDKIKSNIWQKSIKISNEYFNALNEKSKALYENSFNRFIETVKKIEQSALPPEIIGKAVLKALNSVKPKFRYLPGKDTKFIYLMCHRRSFL